MENLKSITTENLIKELNNRGYKTDLLISKWDVITVLQVENKHRPDDEQIKLDGDVIQNITDNIDIRIWSSEIYENIARTINSKYDNENYYVTKEENFIGNAVWSTVFEDGERLDSNCKYDPDTNEVKEVEEFDPESVRDSEICVNEFLTYDGQMITSFKYKGKWWS